MGERVGGRVGVSVGVSVGEEVGLLEAQEEISASPVSRMLHSP